MCESNNSTLNSLKKQFENLNLKFCTKNEYYGLQKSTSDQQSEVDDIRKWKNSVEGAIETISKSADEL